MSVVVVVVVVVVVFFSLRKDDGVKALKVESGVKRRRTLLFAYFFYSLFLVCFFQNTFQKP